MDLTSLDVRAAAEGGAAFDLLHPGTGEKTGVRLTVRGYDSEAVEAAGRDVSRAAMRAKEKRDPAELMLERRVAMAQAALLAVDGGSGDTATAEQVRAFIAKPGGRFVLEQIEAFAGDRGSFFGSAETP